MTDDLTPNAMWLSGNNLFLVFSIGLSSRVVGQLFRSWCVSEATSDGDEVLHSPINWERSGEKISPSSSLVFFKITKTPNFATASSLTVHHIFSLPFHQVEERKEEGGQEENDDQVLAF